MDYISLHNALAGLCADDTKADMLFEGRRTKNVSENEDTLVDSVESAHKNRLRRRTTSLFQHIFLGANLR